MTANRAIGPPNRPMSEEKPYRHVDEIARLRAQVAELREVLNLAKKWIDIPCAPGSLRSGVVAEIIAALEMSGGEARAKGNDSDNNGAF